MPRIRRITKTIDALFGSVLCRLFARAQNTELPPGKIPASGLNGKRVLFIRPGGIGDALLLLPSLKALKTAAPRVQISVLCEERNAAVFSLAPFADRLLRYDRAPLATLRDLHNAHYDLVFDTEQFHHFSGIFSALAKAPVRVGFSVNPARLGLYTHLVMYQLSGAEDAQFFALLEAALSGLPPMPSRFGILSGESSRQPASGNLAALHPGASLPCKRWSPKKYAALCAALCARGFSCVLLGGKEDIPVAREVLRHCPPGISIQNRCGTLSLKETSEVCRNARLFIGNDSGLAHLAVAAGTRAVTLFGPGDPRKWGPPENGGIAVQAAPACAPCSVFGYTKPCRNHLCMRSISVEQVLQHVPPA